MQPPGGIATSMPFRDRSEVLEATVMQRLHDLFTSSGGAPLTSSRETCSWQFRPSTPGCKPRSWSAPRGPSRPRLGSGDTFEESIQKLDLRRVELPARLVELEEAAAIHLGKLL